MVSNATLHNMDEIKRKDIRIGDEVIVRRAGDVIPEVVKPIISRRKIDLPQIEMLTQCPICQSSVSRAEGQAAYRCQAGIRCSAQKKEGLKHYVSRKAMDIDGLGDKLIEQMVEEKLIDNFSDLYQLDIGKLLTLERMAEKSANNVIDAIQTSKKTTLAKFLFALGIREVGQTTAESLAHYFLTLKKVMSANYEELLDVDDIGPIVAQNLVDYFNEDINRDEVLLICHLGVEWPDLLISNNQTLKGNTYVITGTLELYSRQQAAALLKSLGAKVSSSVSKKTSAVIAGAKPGSKVTKAEKLDVQILTEQDLKNLVKDAE